TFDRLFASRTEAIAALPANGNGAPILNALAARLREMGDVVARDFTPEEKSAFAAFIEQKKAAAESGEVDVLLLPLAEHAGLTDVPARGRTERLEAARRNESSSHLARLVQLQTERLRFGDLAQELERFADAGGPMAFQARVEAADAFHKAANPAGEV